MLKAATTTANGGRSGPRAGRRVGHVAEHGVHRPSPHRVGAGGRASPPTRRSPRSAPRERRAGRPAVRCRRRARAPARRRRARRGWRRRASASPAARRPLVPVVVDVGEGVAVGAGSVAVHRADRRRLRSAVGQLVGTARGRRLGRPRQPTRRRPRPAGARAVAAGRAGTGRRGRAGRPCAAAADDRARPPRRIAADPQARAGHGRRARRRGRPCRCSSCSGSSAGARSRTPTSSRRSTTPSRGRARPSVAGGVDGATFALGIVLDGLVLSLVAAGLAVLVAGWYTGVSRSTRRAPPRRRASRRRRSPSHGCSSTSPRPCSRSASLVGALLPMAWFAVVAPVIACEPVGPWRALAPVRLAHPPPARPRAGTCLAVALVDVLLSSALTGVAGLYVGLRPAGRVARQHRGQRRRRPGADAVRRRRGRAAVPRPARAGGGARRRAGGSPTLRAVRRRRRPHDAGPPRPPRCGRRPSAAASTTPTTSVGPPTRSSPGPSTRHRRDRGSSGCSSGSPAGSTGSSATASSIGGPAARRCSRSSCSSERSCSSPSSCAAGGTRRGGVRATPTPSCSTIEAQRSVSEWDAAAARAEAAGDWKEGLRCRFGALVARLVAAGVVPPRAGPDGGRVPRRRPRLDPGGGRRLRRGRRAVRARVVRRPADGTGGGRAVRRQRRAACSPPRGCRLTASTAASATAPGRVGAGDRSGGGSSLGIALVVIAVVVGRDRPADGRPLSPDSTGPDGAHAVVATAAAPTPPRSTSSRVRRTPTRRRRCCSTTASTTPTSTESNAGSRAGASSSSPTRPRRSPTPATVRRSVPGGVRRRRPSSCSPTATESSTTTAPCSDAGFVGAPARCRLGRDASPVRARSPTTSSTRATTPCSPSPRWRRPAPSASPSSTAGSAPAATTLVDLVPTDVRQAIIQLVVAFVLLVLWAGRRLGRPVLEPQPVAVEGAELVAAVGRLLDGRRRPDEAAAAVRAATRRTLESAPGPARRRPRRR